MTDPAAEAAFEKWLRDHPPGTANVHTAFIAGRRSGLEEAVEALVEVSHENAAGVIRRTLLARAEP